MGALFCLIYVDQIKYYLTEANIFLFADDTHFCLLHLKVYFLCLKKETVLNEFVSWPDSNYLTHNYSKTNYIVFSRITSIETDLKSRVGNSTTERVKTCRYLCFIVYGECFKERTCKEQSHKVPFLISLSDFYVIIIRK